MSDIREEHGKQLLANPSLTPGCASAYVRDDSITIYLVVINSPMRNNQIRLETMFAKEIGFNIAEYPAAIWALY